MSEWDYRFKFTFTGDSGVGKTTCIYKFLQKTTANLSSTIGVEYIMKMVNIAKTKVMLHIWDTVRTLYRLDKMHSDLLFKDFIEGRLQYF